MNWPTSHEDWFNLGHDLQSKAIDIIESVPPQQTLDGLNDPLVYSATLLLRTLHSVRVTFDLARGGNLTEANIITRSCVENVLWLRGLNERGLEFVAEIRSDTLKASAGVAETIHAMSTFEDDAEMTRILKRQIAGRSNRFLQLSAISSSEDAKLEYSVFRMISGQYAHPSMISLGFHITKRPGANSYVLTLEPDVSVRDLLWTMFITAGAALSALGLYLEMVQRLTRGDAQLAALTNTLQLLTDQFRAVGSQAGLDGSSL